MSAGIELLIQRGAARRDDSAITLQVSEHQAFPCRVAACSNTAYYSFVLFSWINTYLTIAMRICSACSDRVSLSSPRYT
jgi:hypothetical protein